MRKLIMTFALLTSLCGSASSMEFYSIENTSPSQKRTGPGINLQWTVRWRVYPDGGTTMSVEGGTFWVYRDGVLIAELYEATGYTDYDVVAGHSYSYMVTTSLGGSWSKSMSRVCVCSYEVDLEESNFTLSPEEGVISFNGTLTTFSCNYDGKNLTSSSSTYIPIVSVDCDWINTERSIGSSNYRVLKNTNLVERVAHVKLGNSYCSKIATVTQLPDKVAANGYDSYWDCFVAGIDPTDPESKFLASITFDNDTGKPVIGWLPELTSAEAAKRTYKKYGKVKLTDSNWTEIVDNEEDYNFFKVSVELK